MSGLRSMTGFGAGRAERDGLDVRVELRSVNHRFLQFKLRVPNELSGIESELEGLAKKGLARGAVNGAINYDATAAGLDAPRVDVEVAEQLLEQLRKASHSLGLFSEPTFEQLLSLPGVVRSSTREVDADLLGALAREAFDAALEALVAMRTREGAALADDLTKNVAALEDLLGTIRDRSPESVRQHQQNLQERVAALLGPERPLEDKDLAREIALLADKLDVAEETSRLGMHLEQLRDLVSAGGAVGRKLDFVVQECLREVNTIGSKCNDVDIARAVVDAKTLVERLREQVQNVE